MVSAAKPAGVAYNLTATEIKLRNEESINKAMIPTLHFINKWHRIIFHRVQLLIKHHDLNNIQLSYHNHVRAWDDLS